MWRGLGPDLSIGGSVWLPVYVDEGVRHAAEIQEGKLRGLPS